MNVYQKGKSSLKHYIRFLLKYRIAVLIFLAAMTVFFGFYARRMATDNSIEIWLPENDEDLNYYRTFLNKFGNEEFLIIAFSSADIFTGERIREMNIIAEKLRKLHGVVTVISLADIFKDKITSDVFKEKIKAQQGRSLMNVFKQHLRKDPVYENNVISKNGKTTAIIATVESLGSESRKQLVSEVREILHEMSPQSRNAKGKKHRYYLAGPTVINAELDRMSKQDMAKFTPLMFVMSIIVLGCLFRNVSGVLIPLLMVGLCIVWVTGCFVLFGQTINMISNMLLPLTFIIALSTAIHMISHYYHEGKLSPDKEHAVYHTIRHIGVPILMTTITTIIGFISLATSSIPPVFTTGLFMSGCSALTFLMSMVFIPILISFIPFRTPGEYMTGEENGIDALFSEDSLVKKIKKERDFSALLFRLGEFTVRYKTLILLAGLAVGMIFFWGISRVRIESDIMTSFSKNSRIARDNNYIERHLTGLLPVEIVAETTNGMSVLQPDILKNLVSLQKYLRTVPEVTNSLSLADYIQKAHQSVRGDKSQGCSIPDTEQDAMNYVRLASVYGDKYMGSFFTGAYAGARISLRMKQVGSNRYQAIMKSIRGYINTHLNTRIVSWRITGIVPLLITIQDNILWSEIRSFSLAFLLVFISTAVVLKSVKIGCISIIPNVLPITITLGLMGFIGVKLDAATIMIASIALGVSVDNTIHIFYRFKKEYALDADYSKAVCRTLQSAGKTALITSLSAAFGFMVFSFSSFKPIQYFGMLTGITMINAVISDLFISPSCLLLFKPRFL